jgi:L-ascorbate metabolism protein UlaG (beta-lactamase superfamily)
MKIVHMNPEEAVQAHLDLGAAQSVAIHFGTFQLTSESIDQPVKDLDVARAKYHLTKSEFSVLREGRTQIYNLKQASR